MQLQVTLVRHVLLCVKEPIARRCRMNGALSTAKLLRAFEIRLPIEQCLYCSCAKIEHSEEFEPPAWLVLLPVAHIRVVWATPTTAAVRLRPTHSQPFQV